MEDGWKRIRTEIMMSHIENLVFPGVHGVCSICSTTINSTGTIRCQDWHGCFFVTLATSFVINKDNYIFQRNGL